MRLLELVEASRAVAATRSRTSKLERLAATLRSLGPEEVAVGVAYLSGEPRQDRLDLGPAAIFGASADPATEPSLELLEVDAAFQDIAEVAAGTGSRGRRIERFEQLLSRATEDEQSWLRSLAVRELRQGALEGLLVQAIARAADVPEPVVRRAAMLSGDLRTTAAAAFDGGSAALESFRLQVGVPLQPMLAATAPSIDEAIGTLGQVVIEAKLDGARVQVHRDGDDVRVYTRNLNEVTARVPEVVAAARSLEVDRIVLDGEALAFDADGRPQAFQDTMSRFGRDVGVAGNERPLAVRFFDVLHLDGRDVLDLPLADRLDVLRRVVPDELRPDQLITDDLDATRAFLRATLAAGHEGVMVKSLDTPYEAGRRGSGWRKVKPVHTLDLVVLAAEWGSGRRRGWLSNLHLGARADDDRGFVMLGKTFKGLTDELLTWQTEQLLARETHRDGHVVHVRPELVVEIALDGVVRSTRYPGGLSLRFARVRGYRPDKDPGAADTLSTVRAIHTGDRPPL